MDVWKFDIHMLPRQFFVLIQFSVANYLDIENQRNNVDLRNMFVYQQLAIPNHFHRFFYVPRKPIIITKNRKYTLAMKLCCIKIHNPLDNLPFYLVINLFYNVNKMYFRLEQLYLLRFRFQNVVHI